MIYIIHIPETRKRARKNWINKVHERLEGFNTFMKLPAKEQYALKHPKTVERQVKQNDYYDTL